MNFSDIIDKMEALGCTSTDDFSLEYNEFLNCFLLYCSNEFNKPLETLEAKEQILNILKHEYYEASTKIKEDDNSIANKTRILEREKIKFAIEVIERYCK